MKMRHARLRGNVWLLQLVGDGGFVIDIAQIDGQKTTEIKDLDKAKEDALLKKHGLEKKTTKEGEPGFLEGSREAILAFLGDASEAAPRGKTEAAKCEIKAANAPELAGKN